MNLIYSSLEIPNSARKYYQVASIISEDEPGRVHHNAQVDKMPQEVDDLLHNNLLHDVWIYANVKICR